MTHLDNSLNICILEVQCVDISHKDAVRALKQSRHMMLTLRHVGKLPHAKIDKMKLLVSTAVSCLRDVCVD